MRWSRAFLPVLKESPADAQIVSHKLMLRAGLVRQTAAGIYAWLPLGFRVLKKIEQIVRDEQDRSGAIEMLMPTRQSAELWRTSGRYDGVGPERRRAVPRVHRPRPDGRKRGVLRFRVRGNRLAAIRHRLWRRARPSPPVQAGELDLRGDRRDPR